MSGAPLRAYADALTTRYGRTADNAAHALDVLADLVEGVPPEWAGVHCAACGDSLRDGGHRRERGGHAELVCIACVAEAREAA